MIDEISENFAAVQPVEYYKLIRSQIEHEDNLNSQRLSWFVASQSFLFTAYAIVVSNIGPGHTVWVERQQHRLLVLILDDERWVGRDGRSNAGGLPPSGCGHDTRCNRGRRWRRGCRRG